MLSGVCHAPARCTPRSELNGCEPLSELLLPESRCHVLVDRPDCPPLPASACIARPVADGADRLPSLDLAEDWNDREEKFWKLEPRWALGELPGDRPPPEKLRADELFCDELPREKL